MMALLAPAVFLLSSAVLAFEILLLRLFAIETFHHFAHMAIGVALLGSGASGALLVLAGARVRGREQEIFAALCGLSAVSLILAPVVTHALIPMPGAERGGLLPAALLYVTLASPFLASGAAHAVALQLAGARVGRVYAWNLLGAATGTLLSLFLLNAFSPARAMAAAAVPAAAAAVLAVVPRVRTPRGWWRRTLLPGAAVALVLLAVLRPPWTPRVGEAKPLARMEADGRARRVAEHWGPGGWVVALDAPGFQHAPGLSLAFRGVLPPQIALFRDAELVGAATVHDDESSLEFLHWLPSAAAYTVGAEPPGSVLVIGGNGGLEVLGALARGASHVTALESVRALAAASDASVPAGARVFADERVSLVIADARAYVAAEEERFDVIAMPASPAGDGIGPVPYALTEDFANTVEAYEAYLRRLAPDGVLAITRWLGAPPRENLRTILTAAAALERLGVDGAADRIVLVRSWATGTLLVKPAGFAPHEIARIRSFAAERFFDLDVARDAGLPPPEHDLLARPIYEHALRAAAAGSVHARSFAARYPYEIAPPTDDRPYSSSVPGRSPSAHGFRSSGAPASAEGAILGTLAQSAAAAAVLLLVPMLAIVRRQRAAGVRRIAVARTAAYFAAIGLGFVFVEIAAIQRLSLLLGHPVYATALTLAAILAFSGIGSALSDRLPAAAAAPACLFVAAAAAVIAPTLHWTGAVAGLPLGGRAAAALALVALPALLLGGPFPLGLRRVARGTEGVAWAWAANGVAAVLGTSLAALLAVELGGRVLLFAGAFCYVAAALVARRPVAPVRAG